MMMMIKLTCKKKRSDDISRWLVSTGDRSWRPHCRLSVTPSVCLLQSVAMSVDISVYIGDTVANVVAAAAAAAVNLEKFSINDVDWDWLVRSSLTHKQPVTQQPPYISPVLCLNVRVFVRFRLCVLQSTANRRRQGALQTCAHWLLRLFQNSPVGWSLWDSATVGHAGSYRGVRHNGT